MNIPKIVHPSWHGLLGDLWKDSRLDEIQRQLAFFNFTPEARMIFRAFALPVDKIRVVIVALSPYNQVHRVKEGLNVWETKYATGLAMGTPGFETSTLKAIKDCLWNDYYDVTSEDLDLTLEHWEKQGVMLLNKALTVTVNSRDAREHIEQFTHQQGVFPGWKWFTSEVIRILNKELNATVFCFLGKDAQEYSSLIDEFKNYVINVCHPAARSYWKGDNPVPKHLDFGQSELFSKIDKITYNIDETKIKWY